MEQQSPGDVTNRAYGLGRNFGRTAKGLLFLGALLLATGLFAEAAGASSSVPTLTAQRATFSIPASNPSTLKWTMNLWKIGPNGHQALVGTDSGTSGRLVIAVPKTPTCRFQVDVDRGVHYFSGYQKYVQNCGSTTPTTSGSTPTTQKSTPTTQKSTPTTSKPKTGGGTGGSTTTVATKSGGSATTAAAATKSGSSTSVSPGELAFTGVGVGMWVIAAIGALLMLCGTALLLYVRRYPRAS